MSVSLTVIQFLMPYEQQGGRKKKGGKNAALKISMSTRIYRQIWEMTVLTHNPPSFLLWRKHGMVVSFSVTAVKRQDNNGISLYAWPAVGLHWCLTTAAVMHWVPSMQTSALCVHSQWCPSEGCHSGNHHLVFAQVLRSWVSPTGCENKQTAVRECMTSVSCVSEEMALCCELKLHGQSRGWY